MHRVGMLLFALCALSLAPSIAHTAENDSGWWAEESATHIEDDPETADPASAMRLRILSVVDDYGSRDRRASLSPCDLEQSKQRRFICWSSHGRNLHVVLPAMIWDMVYSLRPRTLYSYKSVDVRMPPAVRVNLPLNTTTDFGYEDDVLGFRIRLKF